MRRGRRRHDVRSKKHDPAIGLEVDVTIDAIGRNGDGIGRFEHGAVYVAGALPGDRLTVRLSARRGDGYAADVVAEHSRAQRRQPSCRHFGDCGGCQLQQVPTQDYQDWKRRQVETALASRGLDSIPILPIIEGRPATRRRLRLAFQLRGKSMALGFRQRHGQDVVDIAECPVAMAMIARLFCPLRLCLAKLPMGRSGGEVAITASGSGLDLLLETPLEPALTDREGLAALAEQEDLARISWRPAPTTPPEPIAARREVIVEVAGQPLALPPGAFLQATEPTETAIRVAVTQAIGDARRIADLFAGCGAFSLPFAKEGRSVHAFEQDKSMIEALTVTAGRAGLKGSLRTAVRDLDREPLSGDELAVFDALILDPPRAGARAQAKAIATSSGPKKIAMVSCNPVTFARDARVLIDAGYRLAWVQPIDAFLWSAQIELVGAFDRAIAP